MKNKILFFLLILAGMGIAANTTRAADYNNCCVCQVASGYGYGAMIHYFLPDGSTKENPITDPAICGEKRSFGTDCMIREHELCGEVTVDTTKIKDATFGKINLGITIPQLRFSAPPTEVDEEGNIYIPWIGEYIKAIYNFSMIVISIIATVIIIIQGLRISASAGGPAKAEATQKIGQAVIGLLLAWGSYFILFTINPELTEFRSLSIRYVGQIPNIILVDDEPLLNIPDTIVNNVPDLKQFDKRWGAEVYGYNSQICQCGTKDNPGVDRAECSKASKVCCTNIQASGCAPTSLAMVLRAYGVAGVTPLDTANYIGAEKGNGRVCNNGTNFDAVIKSLSGSPWNNFSGKKISQDEAYETLKKGKPIVFLCSGCTGKSKSGTKTYKSGHYMVLTGLLNSGGTIDEDYTVTVNDPGANPNRAITTMTKSQLLNNNGFWYVYKKE